MNSIEIPADHRGLSEARIASTSWLEACLSEADRREEIVADVMVVLTELASNVIDHTASASISVRIEVGASLIMVEVGNRGGSGALPDVSEWEALGAGDRGRGLRIVREICCDIEINEDRQCTQIRATVAIS